MKAIEKSLSLVRSRDVTDRWYLTCSRGWNLWCIFQETLFVKKWAICHLLFLWFTVDALLLHCNNILKPPVDNLSICPVYLKVVSVKVTSSSHHERAFYLLVFWTDSCPARLCRSGWDRPRDVHHQIWRGAGGWRPWFDDGVCDSESWLCVWGN